jgi:hypothetical protein
MSPAKLLWRSNFRSAPNVVTPGVATPVVATPVANSLRANRIRGFRPCLRGAFPIGTECAEFFASAR